MILLQLHSKRIESTTWHDSKVLSACTSRTTWVLLSLGTMATGELLSDTVSDQASLISMWPTQCRQLQASHGQLWAWSHNDFIIWDGYLAWKRRVVLVGHAVLNMSSVDYYFISFSLIIIFWLISKQWVCLPVQTFLTLQFCILQTEVNTFIIPFYISCWYT